MFTVKRRVLDIQILMKEGLLDTKNTASRYCSYTAPTPKCATPTMEYSWSTSGAESLSCHLYCTTPNATIHWTVTFSKGNPNERQWSGTCSNGGYISSVPSSYYPLTITAYATAPGYTQSNSVTRTTSPY